MFQLKNLTGNDDKCPIIGAVKVNKPFTFRDSSYECAAWWEERTADTGVFPVYLGRSFHHPKNLIITAHIKAKVTDDYFPGLWGGVRISNEPYKPKHIGEERTIRKGIEVIDAIEQTGCSPGCDLDWFIHPSWWKFFHDEAEQELREGYRRLPEFWNEWNNLDPQTFQPKQDGRWQFDDEYRTKVGMVGHFGMLIEKWARRIERISRQSSYHNSKTSEYWQANFRKNTEWVSSIQIVLPETL